MPITDVWLLSHLWAGAAGSSSVRRLAHVRHLVEMGGCGGPGGAVMYGRGLTVLCHGPPADVPITTLCHWACAVGEVGLARRHATTTKRAKKESTSHL